MKLKRLLVVIGVSVALHQPLLVAAGENANDSLVTTVLNYASKNPFAVATGCASFVATGYLIQLYQQLGITKKIKKTYEVASTIVDKVYNANSHTQVITAKPHANFAKDILGATFSTMKKYPTPSAIGTTGLSVLFLYPNVFKHLVENAYVKDFLQKNSGLAMNDTLKANLFLGGGALWTPSVFMLALAGLIGDPLLRNNPEANKDSEVGSTDLDVTKYFYGKMDDSVEKLYQDIYSCYNPVTREFSHDRLLKKSRAMLLYGPSGASKTAAGGWVAQKLAAIDVMNALQKLAAADTVSTKWAGHSAQYIKENRDAITNDAKANPNIIFILMIDEVDVIAEQSNGGSNSGVTKNANDTAQALRTMIEALKLQPNIIIIGTTNYLERVAPNVQSQFNKKIEFKLPSMNDRHAYFFGFFEENRCSASPETLQYLAKHTELLSYRELKTIALDILNIADNSGKKSHIERLSSPTIRQQINDIITPHIHTKYGSLNAISSLDKAKKYELEHNLTTLSTIEHSLLEDALQNICATKVNDLRSSLDELGKLQQAPEKTTIENEHKVELKKEDAAIVKEETQEEKKKQQEELEKQKKEVQAKQELEKKEKEQKELQQKGLEQKIELQRNAVTTELQKAYERLPKTHEQIALNKCLEADDDQFINQIEALNTLLQKPTTKHSAHLYLQITYLKDIAARYAQLIGFKENQSNAKNNTAGEIHQLILKLRNVLTYSTENTQDDPLDSEQELLLKTIEQESSTKNFTHAKTTLTSINALITTKESLYQELKTSVNKIKKSLSQKNQDLEKENSKTEKTEKEEKIENELTENKSHDTSDFKNARIEIKKLFYSNLSTPQKSIYPMLKIVDTKFNQNDLTPDDLKVLPPIDKEYNEATQEHATISQIASKYGLTYQNAKTLLYIVGNPLKHNSEQQTNEEAFKRGAEDLKTTQRLVKSKERYKHETNDIIFGGFWNWFRQSWSSFQVLLGHQKDNFFNWREIKTPNESVLTPLTLALQQSTKLNAAYTKKKDQASSSWWSLLSNPSQKVENNLLKNSYNLADRILHDNPNNSTIENWLIMSAQDDTFADTMSGDATALDKLYQTGKNNLNNVTSDNNTRLYNKKKIENAQQFTSMSKAFSMLKNK